MVSTFYVESMKEHEHGSEQRELLQTLMKPQPTVIGIEGGPCSGKTTLVERLQAAKSDRNVVVLPEAATIHIERLAQKGITIPELLAHDREGFLAFEADVLRTIINTIAEAKELYAGTDTLIVADRCDIGAYVTSDEYKRVLAMIGQDQAPMYTMVDQLYYLPSVAVESPEKYDELKATNAARYETLEQAIATCQANFAAVKAHPELHVGWGEEFEPKIDRLVGDILDSANETELPLSWHDASKLQQTIDEAYRDGRWLNLQNIFQSYHQIEGQEFRLRHTTLLNGIELYYFTVKQGKGLKRPEHQRMITRDQYEMLRRSRQVGRTLHKTRHEFLQPHYNPAFGLRKWTADYYPELDKHEVEVAIHDESEAELYPFYLLDNAETFEISKCSARELAML